MWRFFFGLVYIEDIYFFEVNTKYISSSVLKTSYFHECAARMKISMFSAHEMNYISYLQKKVNFLFILFFLEDLQLINLLTMLQAESH